MQLEFEVRSDFIADQLLSGLVVGILFLYEDIPTVVEVEQERTDRGWFCLFGPNY